MKVSDNLKYYLITIPIGILLWFILALFNVEFINIIFCIMAYIWHFSLLAPNMKNQVLKSSKFSLLSLVFKANFYLQMFIKFNEFKFKSSVVRAISPLIFTVLLYLFGGSGNQFFTLLGSVIFEAIYFLLIKKIILMNKDGLETLTN